MAFRVGQLKYLDLFQFTMQSLDGLIKTFDEKVDFKYIQQSYPDDEQIYLITKNVVFPYVFVDDISKLDYTGFPIKELADKECKMEDYLHAKLVWETFECKKLQRLS